MAKPLSGIEKALPGIRRGTPIASPSAKDLVTTVSVRAASGYELQAALHTRFFGR
jgi:hypothetical protein